MRNILDVIEKMQDIALGNDENLVGRLDYIKRSAMFTSPEQMYVRWEYIHNLIEDRFPQPRTLQDLEKYERWEIALLDVFLDKSIIELIIKTQ